METNTGRLPKQGDNKQTNKQIKMPQMKEQNITPNKKRTKQNEDNHLPDAEFKTMVPKMLKEHVERIDELSENFNKERRQINMEIENIKRTS